MGLLYTVKRSAVTVANTTNDLLTIQSNATRSFRVKEVAFFGEGTTSATFEIGIYRLTTIGTTTAGAQTPAPLNPAAPAFGGAVNNGWTTQSTVGVLIDSWGVNQNGGVVRWKFAPGEEIEVPGGGGNIGLVWRPTLAPVSGVLGFRALIEEF
jgi:hypothetical protein